MSTTLASMIIGNPAGNVGVSGTIRYYSSIDFTALDGTKYKAGALDSKDYFLSNTWTVSGGLLTVPAKAGFPTTSDASPSTARITAVIYDSKGIRRGTLFENFVIPSTPAGPHTLLYLQTLNGRSFPVRNPETLSKADFEVLLDQAIDNAIGSFNDASTTVKGRIKTSVAPTVATSPIAVENSDPRVLDISNYASFAAMISAIGSTQYTFNVHGNINVTATAIIPENITLRFLQGGKLTLTTGVILTILGPVIADPVKIFFNAVAAQGTVRFTDGTNGPGTYNIRHKEFWVEWWGAKGDNDDTTMLGNAPALEAAWTATPHGGTLRLAGKFYRIDRGVVWSHGFQKTVIGNDSYTGYADNFTKPVFVYKGANGGTALTLSNVYSCTFRGFGVYANDGVNLANGADKAVYLTHSAGGFPALTSRVALEGLEIQALNTRNGWRGIEINDGVGANNEHHTVRECHIVGGGDYTTSGRGYGIYQGHSQVKAIEYIRNNISNVGVGMLVQGSIRCIDNSFTSVYKVYHFSYLIDANFIMGDDIETITRYIETEQHPGASTIVFMGNRIEGIQAIGDSAADFIIKTVGKFSFYDSGFLNGNLYNVRSLGRYAFQGDGSDVLFSNCSLQLGQQTFTNSNVGLDTMSATVIQGGRTLRFGGIAGDTGNRNLEATPSLAALRKTLNLGGPTAQASAPLYLADGELSLYGIHSVPNFSIEVIGTTGATIRRFAIVGVDSVGRESYTSRPNGEFFLGVSNAHATLDGTNYLKLTWASQFPIPTNWRIYEVNPGDSFQWRLVATVADAGGLYQTYNVQANPAGSFVARPFLNQSALLAVNAQLYFPNEQTFADGDTTPSVGIGNDFVEADTAATNTTTFDDGTTGQVIRVRATTANRTLVNGATLITGTGANVTMTAGYVYQFVYRANAWRRVL